VERKYLLKRLEDTGRMMMKQKGFLFILFLLTLLAACSPPSATPTETLAPTDTPTETQTQPTATKVKPTATPTLPTPTRKPTFTPTVTETLPPPRDPPLAVAYIKDRDVYLWTEGVGSTRLTTVGDARWLTLSDDGRRVAFTRDIGLYYDLGELWAINSDGSELRLLVNLDELNPILDEYNPYIAPMQFDFIPGTHKIAFNTGGIADGMGPWYYEDLRTVDVDTLRKATLLVPGFAGGSFLYSPNGATVALVKGNQILLANANGSNLRNVLTFPWILVGTEGYVMVHLVWASDSKSFTVFIPSQRDPFAETIGPTRVFRVTTAGDIFPLFNFPANDEYWQTEISPDGARILYISGKDDALQTIHEAALDGSYDFEVASGAIWGWAPDSRHFVYLDEASNNLQYGNTEEGFSKLSDYVSPSLRRIKWVDDDRFLYIRLFQSYEIRLDDTSGNSILIDDWLANEEVSFDATHIEDK
jgi:hypothetical protein